MHRGCFVFCEEYTGLQSNEMQSQRVPPYWTWNLGDNSQPTSRQLDMQSRLPRSIGAARELGLEQRVRRPQEKTLLLQKRQRRQGTLPRQTREISCREMSLQELQCSQIEQSVVFAWRIWVTMRGGNLACWLVAVVSASNEAFFRDYLLANETWHVCGLRQLNCHNLQCLELHCPSPRRKKTIPEMEKSRNETEGFNKTERSMSPFPLSFLQLIFIIRQSSQNGKIDVIRPIIYIYNTLAFNFSPLRVFLMSVVKQYYGFKERMREKSKKRFLRGWENGGQSQRDKPTLNYSLKQICQKTQKEPLEERKLVLKDYPYQK